MIRVEREGDAGEVGVVLLDRAERRNALTPDMLDELMAGVKGVADDGARCVLLAGEGRVFCAGFDLRLCAEDPAGGTMRALLEGLSRAVEVMRALDVPVVASAHGAAIAGGCALLGGADVVVSHAEARLGYPVARLGVSPAVSAPFLGADTTSGGVRRVMLEPEPISGAEAARLGLVHVLAGDSEATRVEASAIASRLARKPRSGASATRRWLLEIASWGVGVDAAGGLAASSDLVGGEEERLRIASAWGEPKR